jgi:hypothetical protein
MRICRWRSDNVIPDYVNAFYGPAEWNTQAEKEKKSLDAIGAEAAELIAASAKTPTQQRQAMSCSNSLRMD